MDILSPETRPAALPDPLGDAVTPPRKPASWSDAFTSDRVGSKSWQAYVLAVVATAATFALRLALDGPLGGQPTLVIFTVPIMLSAYLGGLRAGLLATGLCWFLASYYLMPQLSRLQVGSGAERWQLVFVLLAGVVISALNEVLHRARRRAESATLEREQTEGMLRESEKALRSSEAHLVAAQRIAHFGSWELDLKNGRDPADNPLRWSDELFRISGYTRDAVELCPAFFFRLVPASEHALIHEAMATAIRERTQYSVIHRLIRADGEERTVLEVGQVAFDENTGEPVKIIGTALDITERQAAEAVAEKNQRHLRGLIDGLGPSIFVGLLTPDGILIQVNAAPLIAGGLKPEDVLGKPFAETPWWAHSPEAQQQLREAIVRAARGEASRYDVRTQGAGNEFIDVDFSLQPLRDAAGKVIFLVPSASVITERKRVEEELLRSRETFRQILDQIPQRVFWKDRDLVYRGCNHAFALAQGFSNPEQLIGLNDFDTNSKAMAERYRSDDQSVIDLNAPKFDIEEPGIAPDGSPVWLKTSKVPLHDSDGRVVAVLGSYEDVTESKLAKMEIERLNADLENRVAQRTEALYAATLDAQRANLAKSEFLSRMSHELRTPMNAILGFAQVLEFEEGLNSEQRDSVDHILKGGGHLLKLINELLDVSSIEAGRLTLSPEPIALPGILEETVGLLGPLSAQLDVSITALPSESAVAHVQADRQRLKQVLLNLLGNAIKYNRPGGSVTIRCDALEEPAEGACRSRVRLSVTDTGAGLSATQLARLFNPFERLGAEQTHVEGTGLGLVLAKRMVEHMGGTLGVESVVGLGSTFWIELPSAEPPPEQDAEVCDQVPISVPEISTETRVILYVEDNPSNVRLVTRILARRPGIRLLCAETGALGVEMAREHHPDLILLDLHLPDSHGTKVLARLGADPSTMAIPVVMLSADAVPGTRSEMLAAGARAFMTKPLNVRDFLAFVDQFLASEPAKAV